MFPKTPRSVISYENGRLSKSIVARLHYSEYLPLGESHVSQSHECVWLPGNDACLDAMLEKNIVKRAWVYRKVVLPMVELLHQGITPEKIALSMALGAAIGVFPVLGSTTILCAAAAVALRLNLPAIQLVNYLMYPLQLILFLPFLEAGSRVTGTAPIALSMKQVFGMIEFDPWGLIKTLWSASLGAIAIWVVLSPLVIGILYVVLTMLLRRLGRCMGLARA